MSRPKVDIRMYFLYALLNIFVVREREYNFLRSQKFIESKVTICTRFNGCISGPLKCRYTPLRFVESLRIKYASVSF
jgi:hypothetical protein